MRAYGEAFRLAPRLFSLAGEQFMGEQEPFKVELVGRALEWFRFKVELVGRGLERFRFWPGK